MTSPDIEMSSGRLEALSALARRLGLKVNDYALLDCALTHASMNSEAEIHVTSYEALEFLGDAALGLAVAHHLYEHSTTRTPGDLTRMRARVVSRVALARAAERIGLADVIRLGKGEELSGGRRRQALLEDCIEAVIGAIFLDQGWDGVRKFVAFAFHQELVNAQQRLDLIDHKSQLMHYCQARRIALPKFSVVREEGPPHQRVFEVEVFLEGRSAGCGSGASKKEAEQLAAREALLEVEWEDDAARE